MSKKLRFTALTNYFLQVLFVLSFIFFCGVISAEEFSFNLSTKGISFGSFEMVSEENNQQYQVSSIFESTGILGMFTKIKVVSGVHGRVASWNDFRPKEVLSKWKSLLNSKQSRIRYKNNRVTHYEVLPRPRDNPFAIDPYQLQGSIDPLTVTYWMLKKRKSGQLCSGNKKVSEGQTVISVEFQKKKLIDGHIHCQGLFTFLEGFDPNKFKNKKFRFNLIYENTKSTKDIWSVKSMSFYSKIGLIKAVRNNSI